MSEHGLIHSGEGIAHRRWRWRLDGVENRPLGIINGSLEEHLIFNEHYLRRVLNKYVACFNARRLQQGLEQNSSLGLGLVSIEGPIRCRNVLGGIIRDYYRAAAQRSIPPSD